MYSYMTYSETAFIKEIYGKMTRYDYLVIDTGGVVVVGLLIILTKVRQLLMQAIRLKEYFY